MAELDTSAHLLNTSSSKQKFSFPKTERFRNGQKILYNHPKADVIATIKYLELEPVELHLLATGAKTWASEMINLFPLLAPMNLEANLKKTSIKVLASAAEEMYPSFYQGNGNGGTTKINQTSWICTRPGQVRQQQNHA